MQYLMVFLRMLLKGMIQGLLWKAIKIAGMWVPSGCPPLRTNLTHLKSAVIAVIAVMSWLLSCWRM